MNSSNILLIILIASIVYSGSAIACAIYRLVAITDNKGNYIAGKLDQVINEIKKMNAK